MLLEFLPDNILEEFRWEKAPSDAWCPWSPFSADNFMLLYRKQKRMKWIEAMSVDKKDILADLQKKGKEYDSVFQNARKLAFYPEDRSGLELCHSFLTKVPLVEDLIIHTNFEYAVPQIPTRELNDSATGPGLITSTIFGHMLPFDKCTPFAHLKAIRLHKVNLRHCAQTYCRFIDFTNIEFLRLFHCTGADTLLSQLCKSTCLPRKLKVFELQHKDNSESEALMALDTFLCLASGIRDLIIDMDNVKELPAPAGITKHGKTLELLNVHTFSGGSLDCESEENVWSTEDFEKICKSTTSLEQLSCAWPATSLIRSPSDNWQAFEMALLNLTNLVTLNITNWPSNKPSTNYLPRSVYEQLLQSLAQRCFELMAGTHKTSSTTTTSTATTATSTPPPTAASNNTSSPPSVVPRSSKPTLIAFGASDKIYEREESKSISIFLRSKQVTAEGKDAVHAVPISWCLRQFVEPRSEVLDFVLSRQTRPPVREWEREEDDDV